MTGKDIPMGYDNAVYVRRKGTVDCKCCPPSWKAYNIGGLDSVVVISNDGRGISYSPKVQLNIAEFDDAWEVVG